MLYLSQKISNHSPISSISVFLILFFFFGSYGAGRAEAAVIFDFDGENGYQYMGFQNAHLGGGYFSHMGGNVTKPESYNSCDGDTNNFHYTTVSNDSPSQDSVNGSNYALKTPYSGNCPNEGFLRDTTVINVPASSELYVRWYQKWTGNWMSGDVQQKFTKFYDPHVPNSIAGHLSFLSNSRRWRTFLPNFDGHFDKDGITRYAGWVWVNASDIGENYPGVNRSYDDDPNTSNFEFETDRWYCLEMHFRINSDPDVSDAIFEAWVDGAKVMGVYDFKYHNTPEAVFTVNALEFQHVYYNRSATDQPTYMDNIVVADEYVGPVDAGSDTLAPGSPGGLSVI
ncbi:MAG: hypothetical protein QG620_929 [Patescibacteria group bacterium]|nr:hypothetical protein [Patescibacteria group bacterium]